LEGPPPKAKKTRDSSDLSYTRPQGPNNYPPYEALDAEAFNEMRPFDVYPFGQIGHYCAHIPYSSDKKDVFEKTGRENFNGMKAFHHRVLAADGHLQFSYTDSQIPMTGRHTT
jgi:hypothetical protein